MARNRNRNQAKRSAAERPAGTFVDVDINDEEQHDNFPQTSPQNMNNQSPIMQPKPTRSYPYRQEEEGEEEEKQASPNKTVQSAGWGGFLFGGSSAAENTAKDTTASNPKREAPPTDFNSGYNAPKTSNYKTTREEPDQSPKVPAANTTASEAAKPAATGWTFWSSNKATQAEELKTSPKVSPKFGSPVAQPVQVQATSGFKPSNQRAFAAGPSAYNYPSAPPPSRSFAAAARRPTDIESFGGPSKAPVVGQAYPPKLPKDEARTGGKMGGWKIALIILLLALLTAGVVVTIILATRSKPAQAKMVPKTTPTKSATPTSATVSASLTSKTSQPTTKEKSA